jgi:hypothetical protein
MVAFSRSRLETSSAASLTLHFLVTLFDKTFAFAILAFHFRFACILLHVFSKSRGLLVANSSNGMKSSLVRFASESKHAEDGSGMSAKFRSATSHSDIVQLFRRA